MHGDGVRRRNHHRARQKGVMRVLVLWGFRPLLDTLCPFQCRNFGRAAGASLALSFGALVEFYTCWTLCRETL